MNQPDKRRGTIGWILPLLVGGSAAVAVFDFGFVARTFHGILVLEDTTRYLVNVTEVAIFLGCAVFVVERLVHRANHGYGLSRREISIMGGAVAITALIWLNEVRLYVGAQTGYARGMPSESEIAWRWFYYGPQIYPLMNPILCLPLAFGLY